MSNATDFDALYRELGVNPNDGAAAIRSAYRRRVAEIHPDRASDGDSTELQRLNGMYAAAMRFERDFGRLPGAATARPVSTASAGAPVAAQPDVPQREAQRGVHRRWYLLALIVLLIALAWVMQDDPDARSEGVPGTQAKVSGEATAGSARAEATPVIVVGASVQEVLAIQGAPVMTEGNRWLYGPSWLRFDCLQVVDWHSSPLYALNTDSTQPSLQSRHAHRPAHRENCGKIARP